MIILEMNLVARQLVLKYKYTFALISFNAKGLTLLKPIQAN